MRIFLISFDDTDNLETVGTGHVLAHFLEALPYETGYITRHQLFVNERVPFTSHNSSMCATVLADASAEELAERAARFLEEARADGSDPGLCVAALDAVIEPELLVEWGRRAKVEVLEKSSAYELASRCGVHLSEHGGDGSGVVGALAAVGLRLSGNDGRVRGKVRIEAGRLTVRELLQATGFDCVFSYGTGLLADDCPIEVGVDGVKAVYQSHRRTVLVAPCDDAYRLLPKEHLKLY